MALVDKLNPQRFPGMSSKMAAIVGCILGERFTDPALAELCITSDGFVMGRVETDFGMNEFIGERSDLERNWKNLLDAAELTAEEHAEAGTCFKRVVTDWGRSNSTV